MKNYLQIILHIPSYLELCFNHFMPIGLSDTFKVDPSGLESIHHFRGSGLFFIIFIEIAVNFMKTV